MRGWRRAGAKNPGYSIGHLCYFVSDCPIAEFAALSGLFYVAIKKRQSDKIQINFLIIMAQKLGGSTGGLTAPSGAAFFVVALVKIC